LKHRSLEVALRETDPSSNPSGRISCLAPTPQLSILSDEYSRPAVIGHAGSFGSYPDSAEAIKGILLSVLNASALKPSVGPGQSTMQGAEPLHRELEHWEDSSDDNDSEHHQHSGTCTQTDIRFTRHRACWDNTHWHSSKPSLDTCSCPCYSEEDPAATSSLNGFPLSEVSPLKQDCFTQVTLTGGTVTSAVICSGKGLSTSPEGDLAFTRFPSHSGADLLKSPDALEPGPISKSDSNSPRDLSQAEPGNPTGSTSPLPLSAVAVTRSLQDICMLPEDVEKENAHFLVADMMIASLEKMKCSLLSQQAEFWAGEETSGSDGSYHTDSELASYHGLKKSDSSVASSDSGYEGKLSSCALLPVSSPVHPAPQPEGNTLHCHSDSEDDYVIIELEDLENLSVSPEARSSLEPGSNSAEATAQELCRAFRKHWLQTESGCLSSSRQRSVLKEDIPRELESSLNLAEEIRILSKLRASGWAPPRSQIIFNIHPSVKRDAVVAAQNFTCVGCGTPIESKYIRRLRYCDYLGKYFCACCHSYGQSAIPARILLKWDFRKYYVCNFSKHLLDSIWQQPIFNVCSVNKALYTKSKEMARVREVQEQLLHLKKLLKTCRFGESVLKQYEQVPSHVTEELHLFSLDDLVKIKRGQLLPLLKEMLKSSTSHVDGCELCQAKGFICEFCQSADLLFPHQIAKCKRCTECKTCFHRACFKAGACPKCQRLAARRT
ncbi:RUBCL protein, partial [Bucco capensis]|nr:RUBCL protein [Bucco capensis]